MITSGAVLGAKYGEPLKGVALVAKRGDSWVRTLTNDQGRWSYPFTPFDVVNVHKDGFMGRVFGPSLLPGLVKLEASTSPAVVVTDHAGEKVVEPGTGDPFPRQRASLPSLPWWAWGLLALALTK